MNIFDKLILDDIEYDDDAYPYTTRGAMTFQDEYGNLSSYDPYQEIEIGGETSSRRKRDGIQFVNPLYIEDITNPMSPNYLIDPLSGSNPASDYIVRDESGLKTSEYNPYMDNQIMYNQYMNDIYDNMMGDLSDEDIQFTDYKRQEQFEPLGTYGGYTDPDDPRALYYKDGGGFLDSGNYDLDEPNLNPLNDAMGNMTQPARKMNVPMVEDYMETGGIM
jgi:hypothetical protein